MDRGPAGGPPERHLASSVSIILASGEGWCQTWRDGGGMVSDLEGWWRDGVRLGGMVEGWCQTLEGWCQTLFLVLTWRDGVWRDGVRLWRDGVRLCSWFLRAVFETKNKV